MHEKYIVTESKTKTHQDSQVRTINIKIWDLQKLLRESPTNIEGCNNCLIKWVKFERPIGMPDESGPDCYNLTMRVDDLGIVVKVEPGLKHEIGRDWPYRHGPKTIITQSIFTMDFLSKVPATQVGCVTPEPLFLDMKPYFLSFIPSETGRQHTGIMKSVYYNILNI